MNRYQEAREVRLWVCLRCGHKWANRKPRKPLICPLCKSYLWDEEKAKKEEVLP